MAVINPHILRILSSARYRAESAARGAQAAAKSKQNIENQLSTYDEAITAIETPPKNETLNQRLGREQELRKLREEHHKLNEEYRTDHAPETERIEFDPEQDYKTSDPRAKVDRPDEVLREYEAQLNSGEVRRGGNTELDLDRIHNELIDSGQLSVKPIPSDELQSAFGQAQKTTKAKVRQTSKEAERDYWESMGKDKPIPETGAMTLEELQRTTNRGNIRKVEPGTASGLAKKTSSDFIDTMGERQAAQLGTLVEQLPRHMWNRANMEVLAKDVIEADVADKGAGQIFGKSTDAYPNVIDPDIDNFSLRQLEDIFVTDVDPKAKQHIPGGDPHTSARREKLQKFRKEAAQAAEKSGRTTLVREGGPVRAKSLGLRKPARTLGYVKRNIEDFKKMPKANAAVLEVIQERLTGPLNPKIKAEQAKGKKTAEESKLTNKLQREIQEFLFPLLYRGKKLTDSESVLDKEVIKEYLSEATSGQPQQPLLFPLSYDFGPLKGK